MYCSKCGKQLSDDDKFCSKCGTPVGDKAADRPAQPTEWEYAEVSEYQVRSGGIFGRDIFALVATATSPAHGIYEAGRSPEYNYDNRPAAADQLVKYMGANGWELLSGRIMDAWDLNPYRYRFRRQVKR